MPGRVHFIRCKSNLIRPHQNNTGKHPGTCNTLGNRCGVVMVEAAGTAPASLRLPS